MDRSGILAEVGAERIRQDAQWGGAPHDDAESVDDLVQLISDYAGWARVKAREGSWVEARHRMVQVAALAVAAVESVGRRHAAEAPAMASEKAMSETEKGLEWE